MSTASKVKLSYTPKKKDAKKVIQEFNRDQAVAILSLKHCAWSLEDEKLKWNGEDIVKA